MCAMSGARIASRFATLKEEGRAALVTFVMAGDPDYEHSLAILKALPGAGADVIELGVEGLGTSKQHVVSYT